MDRQTSIASDQTRSRKAQSIMPPWEMRELSQVPFIEARSATPPVPVQRDATRLFPARSSTLPGHRPKLSTTVSAPCGSEFSSPASESAAGLDSAVMPLLAPYETRYDSPQNTEATAAPSTTAVNDSSSPPRSLSKSPSRSPSPPPPVKAIAKALPGTMSSRNSRNKDGARTRAMGLGREGRTNRSYSQPLPTGDLQRPLGKRFKSAVKDMFKRDPIDESQFEKIGERHWTDEL